MEVIYSLILAGAFYILLLICYKVMGKREANQMSSFDIVVNIIIANIAASGIVEEEYWIDALGGVIVVVSIHILMAKLQIHFPSLRKPSDGDPSLLVKNGKIDYGELRKVRIQLDELIMILRKDKIACIEEVQYAVLENDGEISIYERKMPTKVFPLPLIVSGELKKPALKSLGKDSDWLLKELTKFHVTNLKKIKYVFYEENKLIVYTKDGMQKFKLS